MLRRPATLITLTPEDLTDFETRHTARLAAAASARQAATLREREERRRRERLEKEKREAVYAGGGQERSTQGQGFAQGFKAGREEDVFVTPTTSGSRGEADASGRAARLANIREKRRAAATAAAAAASGSEGGQSFTPVPPGPPLFGVGRGVTREERIMGAQTDSGDGSFGQGVPGAPARVRR